MMMIWIQYSLRPSHDFPHLHKASTENTAFQERIALPGLLELMELMELF